MYYGLINYFCLHINISILAKIKSEFFVKNGIFNDQMTIRRKINSYSKFYADSNGKIQFLINF